MVGIMGLFKHKNNLPNYSLVSKSKFFDKKWYLEKYPDVAAAKIDPVYHYLQFGWTEGRDPGPAFSSDAYLQAHPDVLYAKICPLVHYLLHGLKENRRLTLKLKTPLKTVDLGSIVESIKQKISEPDIKYVSFDVFDTLVVRPVIEPRDIFYLIANKVDKKYKVDFIGMRYNAEQELNDKNATISDIYKFIQKKYKLRSQTVKALMQEEINCETQLLFLRPDGKNLYDFAIKNGKKVIAVSDMYLPADVIKKILHKNGYTKISKVFVSNEYKARKSDGKLYNTVAEKLKCSPASILHIGDNYQSDYIKAKDAGFQAMHLPAVVETVLSNSIYKNLLDTKFSDDYGARILMGFALNFTFGDSSEGKLNKNQFFPDLKTFSYLYLAPMLYYISSAISLNQDIQKKYKKIFFASRDGYLPSKVYESLRNIFHGLPAEYLYAGRRAYYMACEESFFKYIEKLSTAQSTRYTLRNIIDCYVLDDKLKEKICSELSENDLNLPFNEEKEACIKILKRFEKDINKHIESLKKNAIKYYNSRAEKGRNIVFDCGYSGSVSNALTHITKKPFDKIYVWENKTNQDIDQKNGTHTFALLGTKFNYPMEHIILEETFSPVEGTCIGFDDAGKPMFESVDFSPEMQTDMQNIDDSCMRFIDYMKDVFGDWLRMLKISDSEILRRLPNFAFTVSQEKEEDIFKNIIFPDNVFYSKQSSLSVKVANNNRNQNRKRILLISNEMSYSGAPHSLLRMCRVLKDKYSLTVWTLKPGPFEREFHKLGIMVKYMSEIDFGKAATISQIKSFDLAICNTILTDVPCRIIEKHIHCLWYIREAENIPQLLNDNRRMLLEHVENTDIYCVSEYAKSFIDKTFNTTVNVCHNCVEDFNDGYKKKFFHNKKLNLLVMGNFEPRKGFITAIEAIKKLPDNLQNKVHLNIVGRSFDGAYSKSIFDAIANQKNISYLGEIDNLKDKIDLYKKTDIVIVPSTDESCSLVTLEGIMMGCPVIVTKNVGAKYVVDDDTGWIFETGNSDQLRDILQDVLKGKKDVRKMGVAARQKYLETSNMDIYSQNILQAVRSVLDYKNKKKVLVHLHLYYEEQLEYMLSKLANISGCDYDLYVTTPTGNKKAVNKILKFKPDAVIIKTDNVGYDVWPFVQVVQRVDLTKYDYVLKLHTKAFQTTPNALNKTGFWWRDELIDVLLRDKEQFIKNLDVFRLNPKVGMICSKLMLRSVSGNKEIPEESSLFNKEFKRLKFKTADRSYCAGTMFFARAQVFDFIKNAKLTADDFHGNQETHGKGTLAHVYERILGVAVAEKGYKIYSQVSAHEYDDEVIPVVYATDNAYMPCTIVSIYSLLKNKSHNTKYDLIILHSAKIDKKYIKKISALAKKSNSAVHFFDMKNQFDGVSSQIQHISVVTYYRLLLPSLLKQYNKCIWLDGDTIVCRDLSGFFHIDMENNYIAGVIAPYAAKDPGYCNTLNIKNMNTYVNAGVLLWNLDAMRKDGLESRFMKLVNVGYSMMDQDILNIVCFGRIKLLPLKYNAMNKLLNPTDRKLVLDKRLYLPYEFQNAFSDPVIIHYCDSKKPWNSEDCTLINNWREYAEKTGLFPEHKIRKAFKHGANKFAKFMYSLQKQGNKRSYRIIGIRFNTENKYRTIKDGVGAVNYTLEKKYQDLATRMKNLGAACSAIDAKVNQLNASLSEIKAMLNSLKAVEAERLKQEPKTNKAVKTRKKSTAAKKKVVKKSKK